MVEHLSTSFGLNVFKTNLNKVFVHVLYNATSTPINRSTQFTVRML